MEKIIEKSKAAVSDVVHKHNKHTVDIDQEVAPAVTHERRQETQHENVTHAVDREVHQHHHQTHVQPISDRVQESEQHHHHTLPAEHKHTTHGKDAEVARALDADKAKFKDEVEVLPTLASQSHNTVRGEHVHHHIHDTIQPVVERERVQPHVVHTTHPVFEHVEHEPVIHKGNVLPTKTLQEFTSGGHSLTGGHHKHEHIDYEGDPLKIGSNTGVGFAHEMRHDGPGSVGQPGEFGTHTGVSGAATTVGGHHHQQMAAGPHDSSLKNKLDPSVDSDRDGSRTLGSSSTSTSSGAGPHSSSLANKLDPRVDSDGSKGYGAGHTTGSGTTGTSGLNSRENESGYTTGAGPHDSTTANKLDPRVDSDGSKGYGAGYTTGSDKTYNTSGAYDATPRSEAGYGSSSGTGLGSGTTGVNEDAPDQGIERKQSTTEKLKNMVGLGKST